MSADRIIEGMEKGYRGSRKHILDWTEQPKFLVELLETLLPVQCKVSAHSDWMPTGYRNPTEARLELFGPRVFPNHPAWPQLSSWWLKHQKGANTPNWDLALRCEIEGETGLVLVEAKANVPELSEGGKRSDAKPSSHSLENHERIGEAIAEARDALALLLPGISIGRDRHYQLSNRIAFGWKLASLGIPVVLLYLGFTGDEGIREDNREPLADNTHWNRIFRSHLEVVCPCTVLDGPLPIGDARLWLMSRSRAVLEVSPPAS